MYVLALSRRNPSTPARVLAASAYSKVVIEFVLCIRCVMIIYFTGHQTDISGSLAGLYAGVFFGSLIMWRREQARGHVAGLKDAAPFELFGTKLSYEDLEDTEEFEPLVDSTLKKPTQRRVPTPSIQQH
ncbi:hypothetical protein AC1031_006232 [Aphanomyces cochlioides]|nr:hypothetical protein AC1031_006232 [Aphanomyces cochlioides]